jgi:hypothetical protein
MRAGDRTRGDSLAGSDRGMSTTASRDEADHVDEALIIGLSQMTGPPRICERPVIIVKECKL